MFKMKLISFLCLCSLVAFTISIPAYANINSETQKVFGKTYGQWSAEWWQWAFSSEPAKPVEEGDIDCNDGQQGKVWFLAGTFGGAPVERTCITPIPQGKALFFPLVNLVFFNNPDENTTIPEKREILNSLIEGITCNLHSTIDDIPTIFTSPIIRTQSPPLSFLTDKEAISDGFWVMVPPLDKGEHIIHFTGGFCDSPIFGDFLADATYILTIGN